MRSYWHQAPLFRVAIPFGIGICFGASSLLNDVSPAVPLCLGTLVVLILIFFRSEWKKYTRRYHFGALVFALFFFLGVTTILGRIDGLKINFSGLSGKNRFVAQVATVPQERQNSIRLELEVEGYSDSLGVFHQVGTRLMAYAPFESSVDTLLPGDYLVFEDRPSPLQRPLNPNQFDYRRYLFQRGFTGTVYLRNTLYAKAAHSNRLKPPFLFQRLQKEAISVFERFDLGHRELGVVSALVLGKRDLVDPDTRAAYADAGTVHILAVSGLHVGIIYLFVAFILGKVLAGKRLKLVRLIITLMLLWMYAGITGLSPSVLRAATMFSFVAMGRHYGQFGSIYNMLAASAFLLLLMNPFLIFEVGFQLSYIAVLGIVSMYPKFFPLLASGNFVWDKIWGLAVVSFSAQLATFPLSIYYFNQFPNLFLFTNLLVIPLATIVLYLGILTLVLSWIPYISGVLAFLLNYSLKGLNAVIDFSSSLPYAVSKGLYFTITATVLVYLIIFFLFRVFTDPRHGNLKILGACILSLVMLQAASLYQRAVRTSLTIAHVGGYTAIVGVNGPDVQIWTDAYPDELEKLHFSLDGMINSYKPKRVNYSGLYENISDSRFWSDSCLYAAGPHLLALAGNTADIELFGSTKPGAILWKGREVVSDTHLLSSLKVPLVLDGATPYHVQRKIMGVGDTNQPVVWLTSHRGAYHIPDSMGF